MARNQDDQTLLTAIGQGDTQAFERVYRTHKDALLTAALRMLGRQQESAEDVLGDIFVSLARRAGKLELTGSLRNYLLTSCLNRCRDVLRRRRRNRQFLEDSRSGTRFAAAPALLSETTEETKRLVDALEKLPPEQREVIALHVHGQLKFREIAEMLDISINTVQSRYRYALSALRAKMVDGDVKLGG